MKLSRTNSLAILIIYGLTVFLSSFFLFQIQPVISKIILPWFGGGPAVWTAAMLFFQVLLLGGYGYAHILNRANPKTQVIIHLFSIGAVLLWFLLMTFIRGTPIYPESSLKPSPSAFPVWQVLWVLFASVGIPYLILSTTSSLSQSWLAKVKKTRSPYSFYAISNAASLLALLSYPVLIEPFLSVRVQTKIWSGGFLVFLILFAICTLLLKRETKNNPDLSELSEGFVPNRGEDNKPIVLDDDPTTPSQYLSWIILAACPTILLLAVTNQITQDVASVPFLWILPLGLYLVSFILTFNNRFIRLRNIYALLAFLSLFLGYITIEMPNQLSIIQLIAANSVLLLAVCLFFHSFLYNQRPSPSRLTGFYLAMSVGGALGGVFVSLIAPVIFPDYWEYPIILMICAVIVTGLAFQQRSSAIYFFRYPIFIGTLILAVFLILSTRDWANGSIETYRNFYGVLRIRSQEYDHQEIYNLVHGRIIHGSQAAGAEARKKPTRYYSPTSGIGIVITENMSRMEGKPLRLGMVGLGIGTVAAYGLPGDTIRFYEINPVVEQIARDKRYFTFLSDSPANIEVVPGDARLSMEKELEDETFEKYDILAVDAFSGDSIPTHLMNREAVAVYLSLLKEDGILAFHISNRYLDLEPVVAKLADEYQLYDAKVVGGSTDWLGSNATWILLSRSQVSIGTPSLAIAKTSLVRKSFLQTWTDDYSNLFQVLR